MAMHVVVVEDDPFPRLLQVILDPACEPVRVEAFRHFLSLDLADFDGWLARAPKLQAVQMFGLWPGMPAGVIPVAAERVPS